MFKVIYLLAVTVIVFAVPSLIARPAQWYVVTTLLLVQALILSSEYPNFTALPALEGRDDSERTRNLMASLLEQHPDLLGVYSAGAGNQGIAAALEAACRARDIVWIGHELTQHTRRFLLHGTLDAIINQDPGHEARSAGRILLAHCCDEPIMPDQERIRIEVFLRDNLP